MKKYLIYNHENTGFVQNGADYMFRFWDVQTTQTTTFGTVRKLLSEEKYGAYHKEWCQATNTQLHLLLHKMGSVPMKTILEFFNIDLDEKQASALLKMKITKVRAINASGNGCDLVLKSDACFHFLEYDSS